MVILATTATANGKLSLRLLCAGLEHARLWLVPLPLWGPQRPKQSLLQGEKTNVKNFAVMIVMVCPLLDKHNRDGSLGEALRNLPLHLGRLVWESIPLCGPARKALCFLKRVDTLFFSTLLSPNGVSRPLVQLKLPPPPSAKKKGEGLKRVMPYMARRGDHVWLG